MAPIRGRASELEEIAALVDAVAQGRGGVPFFSLITATLRADPCRQADNARSAFSESLSLQRPAAGELEHALQTAVSGHFVKQWPRMLAPQRHAAIAYTTADPNYRLSVTLDYEDDEGFQWRRTDAGQPKRIRTPEPL
ncbi:hypothetical protein FZI85_13245 [Mycobacterium sp. CBMA293]|uniref:hypothetical protein n=1 Tax=unclassified Mycolicibacterium TaxID=2636767 RepID=UPI0012DC5CCF|nr:MULTISPECIES: hypothetical protein [unclassified Mycolicibacterium]MUL47515.1 hypothetical protein [Mycolicibacterium sp. CBMA 360]MUL59502.1 hypothetical protein [Mycolicibacterium sp. CBMA 335]MUL71227.1 hypothetical protein [Mycolicibacterium sp. CBMA 311]MUL94870.1 hypothetical protein [Mycolicibacterium sp. CBMA 230]MUM03710.1 hypothetical protein [Mycolicibacterium sp. CBMA 213]